ncbi:MAG: hypothetical protein K5696_05130, partial [Lachnospiraceae bacterium]|nr:hypothetical protein [Lachnospiraceae bacterium]
DSFRITVAEGRNGFASADELIEKEILDACDPKTDAEYVKCFGMSLSTGTWTDNAEVLLRDGTAPLKELIATREDVYEYLLDHGIEREKAFEIAEYVRKGKANSRGWKDGMLETMQAAGIPEWYVHSCEKVRYLFPRAHVLAYYRKYVRKKGEIS